MKAAATAPSTSARTVDDDSSRPTLLIDDMTNTLAHAIKGLPQEFVIEAEVDAAMILCCQFVLCGKLRVPDDKNPNKRGAAGDDEGKSDKPGQKDITNYSGFRKYIHKKLHDAHKAQREAFEETTKTKIAQDDTTGAFGPSHADHDEEQSLGEFVDPLVAFISANNKAPQQMIEFMKSNPLDEADDVLEDMILQVM